MMIFSYLKLANGSRVGYCEEAVIYKGIKYAKFKFECLSEGGYRGEHDVGEVGLKKPNVTLHLG